MARDILRFAAGALALLAATPTLALSPYVPILPPNPLPYAYRHEAQPLPRRGPQVKTVRPRRHGRRLDLQR